MFQTDSAAAILPGPALDKVSGKGGKAADDGGAFSQEFEKQVNKVSDPARKGTPAEQEKPTETAEETRAAVDKDASAEAAKAGSEQEKPADQTATEAESGKNLPHRLAASGEIEAAAEMNAVKVDPSAAAETVDEEAESAEPVAAQLASHQKTEKLTADLINEKRGQQGDDKSPVALPLVPAHTPISDSMRADETDAMQDADAVATSDVRVRDVLAQRMMGGNTQDNGASAGKHAKADMSALASIQAGQGRTSQGGFDDVLKMGTTTSLSGTPQTTSMPATQPSAASVPVTMTLALPVQQQGWGKAMAERVMWMARGNIQQAQIQLNPRELGPIDIKISMQHEQTHVNFVAHHVATRDAIEAAIPRLRDMMNEQGLNLGQADVSHHSFGDSSRQAAAHNGGPAQGNPTGGMEEGLAEDTLVTHHIGHVSASGVDYFA